MIQLTPSFVPSWLYLGGYWTFTGHLWSDRELLGVPRHIDTVKKMGTYHVMLRGAKKWVLWPSDRCVDHCGGGNITIVQHPGQFVSLDTDKWFHETSVTADGAEGGPVMAIARDYQPPPPLLFRLLGFGTQLY